MSKLDNNSYSPRREMGSNPNNKQTNISNNNNKLNSGFTQTIPSLPFRADVYDSLPRQIDQQLRLPASTEAKKYKSVSEMNSPKSQVRFSIPIADAADPDVSDLSMSTSPSKIVFPRDSSDDSISDSSITPSITNSANSNSRVASTETLVRAAIDGHLVDMQSKVMVTVPEKIWSFHNERKQTTNNNNKSHQRAQSMQDLSFNREIETSPNSVHPNRGHHRSRSLQSLISQTVMEFNNTSTNDSMNDSQISQVSPLNLPSFNNNSGSNLNLRTPSKATNLYLTSDSPINKHKVPIPLEIALPPFLSPSNKNKKRNSLIYDGESYSVFNEDSTSLTESESASEIVSESTSEIVHDSLLSNSSIASVTYNISFDANTMDPDGLLGIDNDANVNLKDQFQNLKRQKAGLNSAKSPHKQIDIENLPPVPHRSNKPVIKNSIDSRIDERSNNNNNIAAASMKSSKPNVQPHPILKVTKSPNYSVDLDASLALKNDIASPSKSNSSTYPNTQPSTSTRHSNFNSTRSSKYLSPNHAKLSGMIDEYNSSVSPFNKSTPSSKSDQRNSMVSPRAQKTTYTNNTDSIAILNTPSKSIVIPDLDNIPFKTPDNSSLSFTSTNTSNGTLKFFDQFEPLYPKNSDSSPINNSNRQGKLDTAFKFPLIKEPSLPLVSNDKTDNLVQQKDSDYQKTPQGTVKFEERRQKLLASHLSPNNKIGHAHRRSRSIQNMDFMSPHKLIEEELPPTPSLPFDATSTPPSTEPIAPRRSSLRVKSPPASPQKEEQINNIPSNKVPTLSNTHSNRLQFHNTKSSINQTQVPIKPLSSFQSFSTPIDKVNLIPSINANGAKEQRKAYNLLSPRRQLSNSGSNQSSSVNSQFSKDSHATQLTESTNLSLNDGTIQQVKPHFPICDTSGRNDDFKIIKERQKDGKLVEVIVLDDDDDITEGQTSTRRKSQSNNLSYKDRQTHRSPKKVKSPFRKRYNSDTREEQLENYKQLLNMCETTAAIAKETIYGLAGATIPSNTDNK